MSEEEAGAGLRIRTEDKLENLEMWRVKVFAAWEIGRRLSPSITEEKARVLGFKVRFKM